MSSNSKSEAGPWQPDHSTLLNTTMDVLAHFYPPHASSTVANAQDGSAPLPRTEQHRVARYGSMPSSEAASVVEVPSDHEDDSDTGDVKDDEQDQKKTHPRQHQRTASSPSSSSFSATKSGPGRDEKAARPVPPTWHRAPSNMDDDLASVVSGAASTICVVENTVLTLPFLSISEAAKAEAGGVTSDDVPEDVAFVVLVQLLARLVVPVTLTQTLRVSMGLITTIFMGRYLTTEQFAAAATGLTFTNLTAMSIGSGFSAGLDTLATQEHGRRRNSPEIAAIFLRSVLCTFTVYIPMAIFYFFCDPVLALLIHEDLVADTAYFLRMSVFIAAPMLLVGNLLNFAQAQRVTQLGVWGSTVGAVLLPFLLFIFRHHGIPGIIAALSLDRFATLSVVLGGVLRNEGLQRCWHGRTLLQHIHAVWSNWTALKEFVLVGLPVLAARCADTWSFEIMGIIAANMGPTSAAVWNVIMALYGQFFAVFVGTATAAAIRVGNAMGAGKGILARRYTYAAAAITSCFTVICVSFIWICGGTLFSWMQRDPAVAAKGGELSFLIGLAFIFDSMFYSMQGPYRGTGYNLALLYIVMIGMWGVAVPMSLILGIGMKKDVEVLLLSLAVGTMVSAPIQLCFLWFFLPWEKRAKMIHEARVGGGEGEEAPQGDGEA